MTLAEFEQKYPGSVSQYGTSEYAKKISYETEEQKNEAVKLDDYQLIAGSLIEEWVVVVPWSGKAYQ